MTESAGIRSAERQAQMERFAAMYRARHFDADGFDLDGNSVWLETGYEPTAAPIARIEASLAALTERLPPAA